MEHSRNGKGERNLIEDYLKMHCIEEMLDETLNVIVEQRPQNPFLEISKIIEARSPSEMLGVSLRTIATAGFGCGVMATVCTNLGDFKGVSVYPDVHQSNGTSWFTRDYSKTEEIVSNAIKLLDPGEMFKVDSCLQELLKDEPAVLLALSIACCKAGARSKGLTVYKYLSEICGAEMCLPLPVPTVVSRMAPGTDPQSNQQVFLICSAGLDLQMTLDVLLEASQRVVSALRETSSLSSSLVQHRGSFRVTSDSVEKVVKLVRASACTDQSAGLRLALDLHSTAVPNFYPVVYEGDGVSGVQRTGAEISDSVVSLLRDLEVVSVEQPLLVTDIPAQRTLREKLKRFMGSIQDGQPSEGLSYCMAGVGGEERVCMQVVTHHCSMEHLKLAAQEAAFNSIRISLEYAGTVSAAVAMCKQARALGWAIIVGPDKNIEQTTDSFITDFAVGVGAGQLMAGGFLSGESVNKYNRLLEIAEEDSSINYSGKRFRR